MEEQFTFAPMEQPTEEPVDGQGQDEVLEEKVEGQEQYDDAEGTTNPATTPATGEVEVEVLFSSTDEEEEEGLGRTESLDSIHISKIDIRDHDTASAWAEYIIQTLEDDVADYLESHGIPFDFGVMPSIRRQRGSQESCRSTASTPSVTLPGHPSKLHMSYQRGVNEYREYPLMPLSLLDEEPIDESVQVVLHRVRRCYTREFSEGESQTKKMTYVPVIKGDYKYIDFYPRPDDYVDPPIPTRQKSLEEVLHLAHEQQMADPFVDRTRNNVRITTFVNRKKILPPLRDDYYKEERFWTGSSFKGRYQNRQFLKGQYIHPTGVKYSNEWRDGHFHTHTRYGLMQYPRGDTFEGQWYQGRYLSGEITFGDGLRYENKNWGYCEPPDRRFKFEKNYGIRPAGATIFNDQFPQERLPPGTYDVGEGIYFPQLRQVAGWDGFPIRYVDDAEHDWILRNCRKEFALNESNVPSFHPDRIPGILTTEPSDFKSIIEQENALQPCAPPDYDLTAQAQEE